jgi:hypothetical protein
MRQCPSRVSLALNPGYSSWARSTGRKRRRDAFGQTAPASYRTRSEEVERAHEFLGVNGGAPHFSGFLAQFVVEQLH